MNQYMRLLSAIALCALAGCAAHTPPAFVVVPRATSRSEEPVTLPLTPEGRQRLEAFLTRGGHPKAADPVPDPIEADHRRTLDALEQPISLDVDTSNSAARQFCEDAAKLCANTALFLGKPFIRQVIDARESRRPVTAPIAVQDGDYWWIFKLREGKLSEVLIVCSVERDVER